MSSSITAYDVPQRVAEYDRDMEIMHPNRAKMAEVMFDVLSAADVQPWRVVDLGAGTGILTRWLVERFPATSVLAIDGATSMLDIARARLAGLSSSIEFRVADIRGLAEVLRHDEPVDVVLSSFTFHHLSSAEKLQLFTTILSRLKPGGWFLNGDIVVAEHAKTETLVQRLRVQGIVARAQGRDERFKDAATTRRYLDAMEAKEGDQPLTVRAELELLSRSGFEDVSLYWQEYREVVYGGRKPAAPPRLRGTA